MNRTFDTFMWGATALLVFVFISLFGSMLFELAGTKAISAPHFDRVWFAIKLSLLTATISSFVAILASVPVAYLFSRHSFIGKAFIDTLLDLPIVLSPIALGAMLLIFFNTAVGKQLEHIFGPVVFEVKGIIVAQFFVIVGLSIRLLKNTFDGIDTEYEILARSLGYSKMQTFLRVVIPMASRGLIGSFLLVWGRAIGEFGATVTLAGATTMKTETVPVAIYLSFESADITGALIYITILVTMSLAILFFVRSVKGGNL